MARSSYFGIGCREQVKGYEDGRVAKVQDTILYRNFPEAYKNQHMPEKGGCQEKEREVWSHGQRFLKPDIKERFLVSGFVMWICSCLKVEFCCLTGRDESQWMF